MSSPQAPSESQEGASWRCRWGGSSAEGRSELHRGERDPRRLAATDPKLLAVDLGRQLLPGTIEHAVNYLFDHAVA